MLNPFTETITLKHIWLHIKQEQGCKAHWKRLKLFFFISRNQNCFRVPESLLIVCHITDSLGAFVYFWYPVQINEDQLSTCDFSLAMKLKWSGVIFPKLYISRGECESAHVCFRAWTSSKSPLDLLYVE